MFEFRIFGMFSFAGKERNIADLEIIGAFLMFQFLRNNTDLRTFKKRTHFSS